MTLGFVLVSAETGVEAELLKELKRVDGVKEAHIVYGVYDLIAKVECESMEELKQTITRYIRGLDHVNGTLTLLVVD